MKVHPIEVTVGQTSGVCDVATGQYPKPGDIFLYPQYLTQWREHLSDYYFQHNAHRAPIAVILPNGDLFIVDGKTSRENDPSGWTVTGTFPNITVSPSINVVGRWHGYLKDGELSEA